MDAPRRSSRLAAKIANVLDSKGTIIPEAAPVMLKKPAKDESVDSTIQVGDVIPDITLPDEDGTSIRLRDITANKGLVIFAYPKASTPGCTKQGCGFRDNYPKIQASDYEVLGLSFDTSKAQKAFKDKQNFPYHLLSDPKGELIKKLGAEKPGGGKLFRSHWIFEKGTGKCIVKEIDISPLVSVDKAFAVITDSEP
ncbi:Peroxiredoxin bcp1 [Schizosaccharomyces pombe]|uniref:Peroxiredoxin bcp1 n=1 Tax=Schizosaccharomyces pombe (strain 972 / ATCC 24843) TaxID=284812 RepID=PRX_SCHPO|nr:putative thioredoxin peroxidase [Schizosaccharomyces pombe]O94561.1 RecName: Full=Peroxiredoxin bcp1; Short=Prx; AltName: Full=Bacterioferritin comigratory protein 1; Short=BCP; AltName: Full=Nuclear thiol peroxidase; Short=nTPx; AltName: Full=Thioredoxin peroxidase; AltName: Full=Thioredoxin-dependent peroxiredoxin bcp1 [Schizosaccharomyces pombe 972h-]ABX64442.1 hypothetical protein [Schizosaccharomyces pombe]CAA21907.1 thioredoxin peroxidase (predicted) [Schizosaccharomyces pombe]|eukprot:NP_595117.1 putative thioredoxin peroxidase [Schizosaccharomyces pombe]